MEATAGFRAPAGVAVPISSLPTPIGWFGVATSSDLPVGAVRPARLGEQDLVAWRPRRGAPLVAEAWCPHLGAHLGHCGRVRDGRLECGFHGFSFERDGSCAATGYGGRVPARARLSILPTIEVGEAVLAWHGPPGEVPSWTVPALDTAGWSPTAWSVSRCAGHPLEVSENSVDVGHLGFVHGYSDARLLAPASTEGPVLRARYEMTRDRPLAGLPLPAMRTEFDVAVHGLGYSQVELLVHTLGARLRLFVLPTPVGPGEVELRLGVSARLGLEPGAPEVLRRLPPRVAARVVRDLTLSGLRADVSQDRKIWATKRHVPRPILAEGDGPILLYRRWAAQFLGGSPSGRARREDREPAVAPALAEKACPLS